MKGVNVLSLVRGLNHSLDCYWSTVAIAAEHHMHFDLLNSSVRRESILSSHTSSIGKVLCAARGLWNDDYLGSRSGRLRKSRSTLVLVHRNANLPLLTSSFVTVAIHDESCSHSVNLAVTPCYIPESIVLHDESCRKPRRHFEKSRSR